MICIPIKKKREKEIISKLTEAQKKADLVEIWFDELGDNFNEETLKKIFDKKKKPIIYKSSGDIKKIETVLQFKPEFIDIDISAKPNIIKKIKENSPKTKLIISYHNFEKTPSTKELQAIAKKILAKKADIIKIATKAKSFSDSLRMLKFLSELNKNKKKAIILCMGKEGEITRTTGHLFGNFLTYAPLNKKDKTADGQLTFYELQKIHKSDTRHTAKRSVLTK